MVFLGAAGLAQFEDRVDRDGDLAPPGAAPRLPPAPAALALAPACELPLLPAFGKSSGLASVVEPHALNDNALKDRHEATNSGNFWLITDLVPIQCSARRAAIGKITHCIDKGRYLQV